MEAFVRGGGMISCAPALSYKPSPDACRSSYPWTRQRVYLISVDPWNETAIMAKSWMSHRQFPSVLPMSILMTRTKHMHRCLDDSRTTLCAVAELTIPARFVVRPQLLKRV